MQLMAPKNCSPCSLFWDGSTPNRLPRRYRDQPSSQKSHQTSTLSRINLAVEKQVLSRNHSASTRHCKHGGKHNECIFPSRTYSALRLQQALHRPAHQASTCSRSSPLSLTHRESICSGNPSSWPARLCWFCMWTTSSEQLRYKSYTGGMLMRTMQYWRSKNPCKRPVLQLIKIVSLCAQASHSIPCGPALQGD